ncbi:MAG: PorV/PorQ family protein [Candidatus Cloacimonadota bacterium]|nr:MAG: PorV/PorQ family protein [Candidatus Cloacimonadota bacterium]
MSKLAYLLIATFSFLFTASMNLCGEKGEAGTELDFLTLGVGARPCAMGGSFISISDDANASYWNPGGLVQVGTPQITGMHTDLDFGTSYDYVSCATPLSKDVLEMKTADSYDNVIGFAFIRTATGDIPITQAGDDTIPGTNYTEIVYKGTAHFTASSYLFSYGRRITDWFSFGLTGKIVDMGLYTHNGTGYGLDMGILLRKSGSRNPLLSNLSLGILIQDLTVTKINWDTDYTDEISPAVKGGITYRFFGASAPGGWVPEEGICLTVEGAQQIKTERQEDWHKPEIHLGCEWKLVNLVPLRVGWDNGNLTAGIGFITKHICVDYGFVSHEELKTTHRIGLTLRM